MPVAGPSFQSGISNSTLVTGNWNLVTGNFAFTLMSHTIGDFEQLILMAMFRLGADAYGVSLREEIEARTSRTVSAGALYTALDRMEKRGLVTSRLGEPTPARGGKRKRLYTLLPAGERALARVYESLRLMAGGVGARLRAIKE